MDNKVLSMADAAYEILSGKKRAILFSALWNDVRKITKSPKENVSRFYEDLTLDPRFVCLKDNKWDLKERRSFADTHVDVKDISLEDETGPSEEETEDEDESLNKKDEDDYN